MVRRYLAFLVFTAACASWPGRVCAQSADPPPDLPPSAGFWRDLGATILSPPNGINHWVFGERYHAAASPPSRRAAFVTGLPSVAQRSDTVGVYYTLLRGGGFGAVG